MSSRYQVVSRTLDGLEIVELHDSGRSDKVCVLPSIGNIAWEFLSQGTPVLWAPEGSPHKLTEKKGLGGIPLLAPWANRLESDTYRLGGGIHQIDASLGNIRRDVNGRPIHGLMIFAPWEVVSAAGTDSGAALTCRFDFGSRPDFLRQFPLAHSYEMVHRLRDGRLTITLKVSNESSQMLPLACGFHPYFSLGASVRQRVMVRLPATKRLELSNQLLPTGRTVDWNGTKDFALEDSSFDDGFVDLIREADRTAIFEATIDGKKLRIGFGPHFEVAVMYAPPTKQFICFEPMTAITNAFNSTGKQEFASLPTLKWIEPRAAWKESFWIELS